MRGSSCCLLIHVTSDTHSSTKSGTFFFSFELCALFGGRSLTAHLGELLAGGSHQVRPPVDARVQEDPSAGSSTAPRHTTRPRTGHRRDRPRPAPAQEPPGLLATWTPPPPPCHRPHFQDPSIFPFSFSHQCKYGSENATSDQSFLAGYYLVPFSHCQPPKLINKCSYFVCEA